MAKGQKRSSKEIRKPKKEKSAVKADDSFSGQIKAASNNNAPWKTGKS